MIKQTKHSCIYILSDPITKEDRYIGRCINLNGRIKEHINCKPVDNPQKYHWIKSLKENGLIPLVRIVEEFDFEDYYIGVKKENDMIKEYRLKGFPIVNQNPSFRYRKLGMSFERI